jgi:hypothetical protein
MDLTCSAECCIYGHVERKAAHVAPETARADSGETHPTCESVPEEARESVEDVASEPAATGRRQSGLVVMTGEVVPGGMVLVDPLMS